MNEPGTITQSDIEARQWGMFIHLGILAGYFIPVAGFIVPIVLWQMKKYEHPLIDQHGKNVANWLLSFLVYGAISGVLCLLLVGFMLLWGLGVLNIIFAIVGGIKANNGKVWAYPFTIKFLK